VINVYGPKIAAAKSEQEANELIALMSYYITQAKLYQRKRPSYPRKIWHSSKPFPKRKAQS
jgi:hypothetical protein